MISLSASQYAITVAVLPIGFKTPKNGANVVPYPNGTNDGDDSQTITPRSDIINPDYTKTMKS